MIGVIVLLVSVLTVALAASKRASHNAHTRSLMGSLRQGLVRFKEDVGYLPPVLTLERDLLRPPDPAAPSYVQQVQDYFSVTTIAEYLLGYGNHNHDGWGVVNPGGAESWPEERPPLGIRHPQSDGVWGATIYGMQQGLFADRMKGINPETIDKGRVYGPYFEIKDERLLASTNGTFTNTPEGPQLNLFFPGEGAYDPDHPKVLADYWGRPIRYYRQVHAPGSLQAPLRSFDPDNPAPTLADVIALRPVDLATGSETDVPPSFADAAGDTTASFPLRTAEFALFSPGSDRKFHPGYRYDPAGFNKDNVVEVGP